jgi:hypothetical protein
MIYVYNMHEEDHTNEKCNYYVGRSKSGNPLGNPFTHNGVRKSIAKLSFKTREEAIERYDTYFDVMFSGNKVFRAVIDDMYEKYKRGEDIYLQCVCKPLPCHGDIIAKKLQQRLLKEKINNIKHKKNEKL